MATKKEVVFMSGKIYWAKITGAPVPNYGGDAREWTFEFVPNEDGLALLKKHGLSDRLKDKEDEKNPDKGRYIVLRKKEFAASGDANKPIRLYDGDDNEWDTSKLIGNGSDVDVKVDIRDYGPGKKKGVYPVAVRVKQLVAYQSSEFGRMDNDGVAPAKSPKKKSLELDDDIPFE